MKKWQKIKTKKRDNHKKGVIVKLKRGTKDLKRALETSKHKEIKMSKRHYSP